MDADQLGALRSSKAELVWAFNEWDVVNPRLHAFRESHPDTITHAFIGWADFWDECVQMPDIQDCQGTATTGGTVTEASCSHRYQRSAAQDSRSSPRTHVRFCTTPM